MRRAPRQTTGQKAAAARRFRARSRQAGRHTQSSLAPQDGGTVAGQGDPSHQAPQNAGQVAASQNAPCAGQAAADSTQHPSAPEAGPAESKWSRALPAGSGLTLDQYFEIWIARKRDTAAKAATPYRYSRWYHNHLHRVLGEKPLGEIQRQDVFVLQGMMAGRYHPTTVNYTVRLLRFILNDAVADDLLEKNPTLRIKPLKNTRQAASKSTHRALTEEEQTAFMAAAKANYYYEFFALLLLTGLRHGEAAVLTWDDVDYDRNVLHITKSLTFDEDGHVVIGAPKSDAGIRDIPMNDAIRDILAQQAEKTCTLLRLEQVPPQRRVFYPRPHPDKILHNATANQALRRVLEEMAAAGQPLERFSLHALRDTFATRFIEQGGNPQTLKTLLGHSTLAMTMDLYSHVLPNTRQKEMDHLQIEV